MNGIPATGYELVIEVNGKTVARYPVVAVVDTEACIINPGGDLVPARWYGDQRIKLMAEAAGSLEGLNWHVRPIPVGEA